MPSGTSRSWAMDLSRRRSSALVILRLMPPPRAVFGISAVAVDLGDVVAALAALGGLVGLCELAVALARLTRLGVGWRRIVRGWNGVARVRLLAGVRAWSLATSVLDRRPSGGRCCLFDARLVVRIAPRQMPGVGML